jgi:Na+-transporting methylmalonyl-CoA/oxaloacetate decarboxylase gamma subunit
MELTAIAIQAMVNGFMVMALCMGLIFLVLFNGEK